MACTFSVGLSAATAANLLIDVRTAAVVGDGVTMNTAAIQKTIDAASASGGGTIDFPAGRYLTGTIQLKSNVTLRLEKDAVLLGSTDAADYRNLDPFIDGSGNPMGHALIVALDAVGVGIEGSGTIDGQGPKLKARQRPFSVRPFLLRWVRSAQVTVRDVTLINPAAWTMNFFETNGAVVDGVTIRSRGLGMHNNDGVNIDSSEHIRVTNCDIDSGDDALVIKSTGSRPSRDIVASHSKLSSHTNAIKLGTESYGGFEEISVSDIQISNTDLAGIALYAVDGGNLRKVTISDVTMNGVAVPVSIRLGARLKTFRPGTEPRPAPGTLSDVTIRNLSATNVSMVGMLINGVAGHPVERLNFENVRIELPGGGTPEMANITLSEKAAAYPEFSMFGKNMPAYGLYIRHARDVRLQNVQTILLKPDARPAQILLDAERVVPTGALADTARR
jgi:polygalacturonase